MISLTYTATFHVVGDRPDLNVVSPSGPAEIVMVRTCEGDRAEEVLAKDLSTVLSFDWAPRNEGDSLRLELTGAWHAPLGIRTFQLRKRHRRRAAERIWPVSPNALPPHRKAVFHLLLHGAATLRMGAWGLSVTRD